MIVTASPEDPRAGGVSRCQWSVRSHVYVTNAVKANFENRPGYISVHPSYLLRIPDADAKEEAYKEFVRDLKRIRQLAA